MTLQGRLPGIMTTGRNGRKATGSSGRISCFATAGHVCFAERTQQVKAGPVHASVEGGGRQAGGMDKVVFYGLLTVTRTQQDHGFVIDVATVW